MTTEDSSKPAEVADYEIPYLSAFAEMHVAHNGPTHCPHCGAGRDAFWWETDDRTVFLYCERCRWSGRTEVERTILLLRPITPGDQGDPAFAQDSSLPVRLPVLPGFESGTVRQDEVIAELRTLLNNPALAPETLDLARTYASHGAPSPQAYAERITQGLLEEVNRVAQATTPAPHIHIEDGSVSLSWGLEIDRAMTLYPLLSPALDQPPSRWLLHSPTNGSQILSTNETAQRVARVLKADQELRLKRASRGRS